MRWRQDFDVKNKLRKSPNNDEEEEEEEGKTTFWLPGTQQHWQLHHSFSSAQRCHLIEFLLSPCGATKVIWQRHLTSKVISEFTLENLLSYIYSLLCCSCVTITLALSDLLKECLCARIYVVYIIYMSLCVYIKILFIITRISIWIFIMYLIIIIRLRTVCMNVYAQNKTTQMQM